MHHDTRLINSTAFHPCSNVKQSGKKFWRHDVHGVMRMSAGQAARKPQEQASKTVAHICHYDTLLCGMPDIHHCHQQCLRSRTVLCRDASDLSSLTAAPANCCQLCLMLVPSSRVLRLISSCRT
eukprot:scaffold72478_cov18-Tisochrysis_lutea.AAC.1